MSEVVVVVLVVLAVVAALIPPIMLVANKVVYHEWFMFPWRKDNPYNVAVRESEQRLREYRERLDRT
jgi:hypothetical protein